MPHRIPIRRNEVLKSRLDELAATIDIEMIAPDPLQLVHLFHAPRDQEVAALLAAAFAYGRASIVVRNVGSVLDQMKPGPYKYLTSSRFSTEEAAERFSGFAHRFHKTADLVALLERLSLVIKRHGSLGNLFRSVYRGDDPDVGPSLSRFVSAIIHVEGAGRLTVARSAALRYLLTSPDDGSACKRMNLFLRWMVRTGSPDLGLWTFVDPSKLIMPLDTHIHRITTFLGVNRRKTADWKTAKLLTKRFARFDPLDPVRYDYALCRLGILDLCSRKRRKENCDVCLLNDVCRLRWRDGS